MKEKYSINDQVKKDLLSVYHEMRACCLKTELMTLIREFIIAHDDSVVTVKTNNVLCAQRIVLLARKVYGKKQQIKLEQRASKRSPRKHLIKLQIINDKFKEIDFNTIDDTKKHKTCCLKAFICGLYWKSGYLWIPKKGLHLELIIPDNINKSIVKHAFSQNGVQMFYTQRRHKTVAYTTSSENIEKFLTIVGATATVLFLQDILITRDIKNIVNRSVNCEVGNLRRSTNSSAKDMEAITFLQEQNIFDQLPEKLQVAGKARLAYPDLNIRELGEILTPPLTKAGVFHRLKKIRKIAENERKRHQ